MSIQHIQESVKGVIAYYTAHPEKAISEDKPAVATLIEGLRCRATNQDGVEVFSDMPKGIGGGATAPTPGWLMRAALANCDATMIALRAAELGLTLTTLEVTVSSLSDDRGLIQIDDTISAGPLHVRVHVKIGSADATPEQLHDLMTWTEKHSPVGDALSRAVPLSTTVEIMQPT